MSARTREVPHEEFARAYEALGSAISAWGDVESSMCRLFCHAISPHDPGLRAAFWSAQSVSAKVKLISKTLEAGYRDHPDLIKEWRKVGEKIIKAGGARGKLAHGTIVALWASDMPKGTKIEPKLYPYFHSRQLASQEKGFTCVEMFRFQSEFLELADAIHRMADPIGIARKERGWLWLDRDDLPAEDQA